MPALMDIEIDIAALSAAEEFSLLPKEEQDFKLSRLSDESAFLLKYDWAFWGRPEQLLPDHDDWDVMFWCAGRGSGKTRPASEAVNMWAENKNRHICIVGETAAEVRDVMVEGPSGILATAKPWNPAKYEPSKRRVIWPQTKAWGTTYSGDSPDQLRGAHSDDAWCDELAKFRYPDDTWDNLEMVLRAGEHPKVIVSSTPRGIPIIRRFIKESQEEGSRTIVRTWSTYRNIANLAPTYIDRMLMRYEGTRLGRQELHAEILSDTPGALWTLSKIDQFRVVERHELKVIAVGVDPPISEGGECGIIVLGLGTNDHIYTLDDMSISGKPHDWGSQVIAAFHKWDATYVVPEINQGGDMVTSVLHTIDPAVPIRTVWASRGKWLRAEPISSYTEKGMMHHIGTFAALEDEMSTYVSGNPSPNRLDAYVHAATNLLGYTSFDVGSHRAGIWGK